jgi:hypothetical protein
VWQNIVSKGVAGKILKAKGKAPECPELFLFPTVLRIAGWQE